MGILLSFWLGMRGIARSLVIGRSIEVPNYESKDRYALPTSCPSVSEHTRREQNHCEALRGDSYSHELQLGAETSALHMTPSCNACRSPCSLVKLALTSWHRPPSSTPPINPCIFIPPTERSDRFQCA
ncbi:hypothetical protein PENSPDRAFT_509617 [Peniophora sp. CONT]|nr:hypothetical protein PENSPDRAFT_509617 [Peniophora sp. CONT]